MDSNGDSSSERGTSKDDSSGLVTVDLKNVANKLFISTTKEKLLLVDANTKKLSIPKNNIFPENDDFTIYKEITLEKFQAFEDRLNTLIVNNAESKFQIVEDTYRLNVVITVFKFFKKNVILN